MAITTIVAKILRPNSRFRSSRTFLCLSTARLAVPACHVSEDPAGKRQCFDDAMNRPEEYSRLAEREAPAGGAGGRRSGGERGFAGPDIGRREGSARGIQSDRSAHGLMARRTDRLERPGARFRAGQIGS